VASGDEFGDAGCVTDSFHDYYGETIAFDFGIINLLKDSRDTAREWFGVGKSGVDVAAGVFELKIVEEIRNEPDERIVLEGFA